mmetsp:Transcript_129585/g.242458  ORF Transcript_129585/g.242458 Transcript_129585/m.242458 type:complete len:531 (-) Transcript_129585:2-1594(-)
MHAIAHGFFVFACLTPGHGRGLQTMRDTLPTTSSKEHSAQKASPIGFSRSLTTLGALLLSFSKPTFRHHHKMEPPGASSLITLRHYRSQPLLSTVIALAGNEQPPSLPGGESYMRGSLSDAMPVWWRQTSSKFQIVCELPDDVSVKRDVSIDLRKETINVHVAGMSVVEGKLQQSIDVDDSDWFTDDEMGGFNDGKRYLVLDLRKAMPNVDWSGPIAVQKPADQRNTKRSLLNLRKGRPVENIIELRPEAPEPSTPYNPGKIETDNDCLDRGKMAKMKAQLGRVLDANFGHLQGKALRMSPSCLDSAALAELDATNFLVLPNFVSSDVVAALRQDHMALRSIGRGVSRSDDRSSEQVQLALNGAQPKRKNDGRAARFLATELIPTMKERLSPLASTSKAEQNPAPLVDFAELAYIHYEPGGFFHPHIDKSNDMTFGFRTRRSLSFTLFLNDLSLSEGGALRLFEPLPEAEQQRQRAGYTGEYEIPVPPVLRDVPARAGTLVLFRSHAVVHEVLKTYAQRDVLAGWLHRPF